MASPSAGRTSETSAAPGPRASAAPKEPVLRGPVAVVVGSCNIDLVASCDRLPFVGETVAGHDLEVVVGGKGVNQAIAAARAGARCRFVGAIGDDTHANRIRAALDAAGVDTTRLRRLAGPSGTALILVDRAGNNLIAVVPGANGRVTALAEDDREVIGSADVLVAQLELPIETVVAAVVAARGRGVPVVLNAAPARPVPTELLAATEVLVVNEHEGVQLAGASASAVDDVGRLLLATVPRVVVTLGAEGAAYFDRSGARLHVPAPRVAAVDTTAAGDTFTGVLAVAFAEAQPILRALQLACAAASLCVERRGATPSIPDRAATQARWAAAYGPADG